MGSVSGLCSVSFTFAIPSRSADRSHGCPDDLPPLKPSDAYAWRYLTMSQQTSHAHQPSRWASQRIFLLPKPDLRCKYQSTIMDNIDSLQGHQNHIYKSRRTTL